MALFMLIICFEGSACGAEPAARRRPGGGDVDSGSTAPYVIEGWRQVIVYW